MPKRQYWRCGRDSRTAEPILGPGLQLRLGHRQDQRDRPDAAHAEVVDCRLCSSAFALVMLLLVSVTYLLVDGRGHLGHQHSHRLGLRDRQFRLVDRDRPRRHADFRDPASAAPAVAHFDQPLCRSHDAVCRVLRRTISAAAHGPSVAGLLAVSRIRTR